MKNLASLTAAVITTALLSGPAAPRPLAADAPPAWSKCPDQLMLNGNNHKLKAEFYVNRMPQVVGDGQTAAEPKLSGTLSLDPAAPSGTTIDHVWLTRNSFSWDGAVQAEIPGRFTLRGGPGWKDGPINVRARVRLGGKSSYLRTSTTLTSAW